MNLRKGGLGLIAFYKGNVRLVRCQICGRMRLGSPCEECQFECDPILGYSPMFDEPARMSAAMPKAGTIRGWLAPFLHQVEKFAVLEDEKRERREQRAEAKLRRRKSDRIGYLIALAWALETELRDDDEMEV